MISALLSSLLCSLPFPGESLQTPPSSVLHLAVRVDGDGYLRFVREGRIVYASSATLTVQSGLLVGSKDVPLTPSMRVPANAIKLDVDLEGNVTATVSGGHSACGRLVLALFDKKPSDDGGFLVSMTRARLASPGDPGCGVIRSGSNHPIIAVSTPPGVAQISIPQVSEVEGATVLLKDIATIKADTKTAATLGAIEIGPSPASGVDIIVTGSRIKFLARRAGIEAEVDAPVGAVIRRKSQEVKEEEFIAAAIKAAQEKIGAEVPMASSDQQADFKAPTGVIELKGEAVTFSGATVTVVVAVIADGKRVNSRTVNLKVDGSAQVKPGEAVKIVMKSAGLTVELPGKVRVGGVIGQPATVVTDTGTVLTGTVIGPGKVEVKM